MTKILLLFSSILICGPSIAQNSFSWQEPGGVTVYGTNPPKEAINIKNLKTRELSKYSSKKLIKTRSARASMKNFGDNVEETVTKSKNSVVKVPVKEQDLIANPIKDTPKKIVKKAIKKNIKNAVQSASLEQSRLKVVLDPDNARIINNCKIDITNIGNISAKQIDVAFEFRDGTLVAASGPRNIKPGELRTYKMALDLLPFKLNFALSETRPERDFKVRVSYN